MTTEPDPQGLDHPILGGRLTLFALLHGDYPAMHRRFLDALLATTPAARIELRFLSNALAEPVAAELDTLVASGRARIHYRNRENIRKYPAMRRAFHDPECPIETSYVIWLDDDTYLDRDPLWLPKLARTIVQGHAEGCRQVGPVWHFNLHPDQLAHMRKQPWYRDRPLVNFNGTTSPSARGVRFATGSFWALHTPTIRELDLPDVELGHQGGDYLTSLRLYQAGYGVKTFSPKKDIVNYSAESRRGLSEKHWGRR